MEAHGKLSWKDYKEYKLDLLLRLAKRVDSFSPDCEKCQAFQREISGLTEDLDHLPQMPKEKRKGYFKMINNIVKHLQNRHKLVVERQNLGIWIILGGGTGAAVGGGLGNGWLGLAIGAGIGLAMGLALDAKAKKEGKVI